MLFDENFADINGRKYRRYTVRRFGFQKLNCSPFDKLNNMFIIPNADHCPMTREQAWEYLRTH